MILWVMHVRDRQIEKEREERREGGKQKGGRIEKKKNREDREEGE